MRDALIVHSIRSCWRTIRGLEGKSGGLDVWSLPFIKPSTELQKCFGLE